MPQQPPWLALTFSSSLALILNEINRLKVSLIASSQGIDTSEENPTGNLQLGVLILLGIIGFVYLVVR